LSKLLVSENEIIAFSGVWKVLGLLLVLPDTNATSDRSFALKTYLPITRANERE